MIRRVCAPGKLVLLGEYAVVDGGDAVVAAVDRGVTCVVGPADAVEIVAPGDDRFVRAALVGAPPGRYTFTDTRAADLPSKPGFGGSAAATVAATLAAGRPGDHAFAVHRAVQGGGSGVDVFASLRGGVRRFPDGAPVPCPPLVAVWSGESASTGERVARYRAWPSRAAFVAESNAIVARFPVAPLQAIEAAYALLRAMARAAGVDYDRPAFARLAALAREAGGAAKPSGAGGGDVAVALFPDDAARAAFVAACRTAGFVPLDVAVVGPPRVEVDRTPAN